MDTIPNFIAITGPAGAGKTTRVLEEIEAAITQGYDPDQIMVIGLTHATRYAVMNRIHMLNPEDNILTMSALCYRHIAQGEKINIIDPGIKAAGDLDDWEESKRTDSANKSAIAEWNVWHRGKGISLVLPGGSDEHLYSINQLRESRKVFSNYMAKRVQLSPVEEWPAILRITHKLWTEFKLVNDLRDFTDLEEAVKEDEVPLWPRIKMIFFDEAQDYSALEMWLVHHFGKFTDYYYAAGDPNQRLYDWRGGNHGIHFAEGASEIIVLPKTWRCSELVYRAGVGVIKQWENAWDYGDVATARPGGVVNLKAGLLSSNLVPQIRRRLSTDPDSSIGVITSYRSSGLLDFIDGMKRAGIKYHNPYSKSPQWVTPGMRLASDAMLFAKGDWTYGEVKQWSKRILNTGVFIRGTAEDLKKTVPYERFEWNRFADPNFTALRGEIFASEQGAVSWFLKRSNAANRNNATLLQTWTVAQMREKPRVVVGTIHSVKGGEMDIVYLCDELSYPDTLETEEWERHVRYYVGITRAKHEVNVIDGIPDRYGNYESYWLRRRLETIIGAA